MTAQELRTTPGYGYDSTHLLFDGSGVPIFGCDAPASCLTPPSVRESAEEYRQFTGKERDAESGLDYFGARYYGSALGRWTSPDPVSTSGLAHMRDPQSWNAYSYVRNNPLEFTDPDGQDWNVCESNGSNCAVVKDDNAFDKFNQQTGNYVENGNYYDSNGNQIGTASWSQSGGDALSMLNLAGRMAEPGVNLAAQGLRVFGYAVAAPAMVAAECAAGAPSCSAGGVAMAVLPELGPLLEGATLARAARGLSAAGIYEKAGWLCPGNQGL
jgi:RHS repeat-associated protein